MLTLERITTIDNAKIDSLFNLYQEAFPECERRDIETLKQLIEHEKQMFFCRILQNGIECGLVVYWLFDTFCYVEHLAVNLAARGNGTGSATLDVLKQRYADRPIVLEVEPLSNDTTTQKRIAFYQRNGFTIADTTYQQPPYRKGEQPFPLWIMTNRQIDPTTIQRIENEIKQMVYWRFYSRFDHVQRPYTQNP